MKMILGLYLLFVFMDGHAMVKILDFDTIDYSTGNGLSNIHAKHGRWRLESFPFKVVRTKNNSKAVSSIRKGHVSLYALNNSLYSNYKLSFKFNLKQISDAGRIGIILCHKDKFQGGIFISSKGSIFYLDKKSKHKYKTEKIARSVFKAVAAKWYDVEIKVNQSGRYDLLINNKPIVHNLCFLENKNVVDGILLKASTSPIQGGSDVLLDKLSLIIDEKKSYNGIKKLPKLMPEAIGASYIAPDPVRFKIINMPARGLTVKVTPVDKIKTVLEKFDVSSAKVTIDRKLKGVYTLWLLDRNKVLDKHNFAILSKPPPAPLNPKKDWIGMCTHLERRGYGSKDFEKELALLKLLGVHWVRMNCDWAWLHTGPGRYNEKRFASYKKICERLKKENRYSLWTIQNNPSWVSCAPKGVPHAYKFPPSGKNWKYWNEFINKFYSEFKDVCNDYEVWCEPAAFMAITGQEKLFPGGLNQAVVEYSKRASSVMHKQGKPIIYGPSSTAVYYWRIEQLLKEYGSLWDNITLHYAQWALEPKSKTQLVKRWIKRYTKRNVPIIYSESGAMSNLPKATGKGFGPLGATHSIEQYFMFWAEGIATRHFSFVLRNRRMKKGVGGIFYNTRFEPGKETVYLQTMYYFYRNAEFAGFIDRPESGYRACIALRNGKFNAVVWKNGERLFRPHDLISENTVIKDCNNNILQSIGDNTLIYLYNINTGSETVMNNLIQLRPYSLMVNKDVSEDVEIILNNPGDKECTYQVKFVCNAIVVTPAEITVKLKPYSQKTVSVVITATSEVKTLTTFPFKAIVNDRNKTLGNIYRFDDSCLKTIQIDDFSKANSWNKTTKFDHKHRQINKNKIQKSHIELTPEGSKLHVVFKKPKRKKWLGTYFRKVKPVRLPGIPVKIKYRFKLDLKDMPNNMTLLSSFKDASGQILNYELTSRLFPSHAAAYREFTGYINSPVYGNRAHNRYKGGANDGKPHYPLKFCGFILNIDPEVIFPDNEIWNAKIDLKDIVVEYYQP